MALAVLKFGGTSVATVEHIQQAARRIAHERKRGADLCVVVSAMAGMTNQLVDYTSALTDTPCAEEYDVVVSAGEQITCGLLALALQNFDIPARSFLGWQIPLKTDATHAKARVLEFDATPLKALMQAGIVPIVAGFQGISPQGRLTTFGRGGSDITAVVLAAALKADRCDLYKDVSGIYTADPRIVERAQKRDHVSYGAMLELAALGSKVLHHRAIEIAMRHNIPLRVFSSFEESIGTTIHDEGKIVEKIQIQGIVSNLQEVQIVCAPARGGTVSVASVMEALAGACVVADMIVQQEVGSVLSLTVARTDMKTALGALQALEGVTVEVCETLAKISVVGAGLRSNPQLTNTLFQTLSERGVDVRGIATSEVKISVLIPQECAELAVRALHTAYGLDAVSTDTPLLYAV